MHETGRLPGYNVVALYGPLGAAVSCRGRAGLDKGTLAMALIGLSGQAGSLPDPRASVRATAPYQARRSAAGPSGPVQVHQREDYCFVEG
jgi:hypothetical protein